MQFVRHPKVLSTCEREKGSVLFEVFLIAGNAHMRVIYKMVHPLISPKWVLMCALLMTPELYKNKHKSYSCAPFMKIIEQWYSPCHNSAAAHSDPSSCVCRSELDMAIERAVLRSFKKKKIYIYIYKWRSVDLQCCVSFRCTAKRFSYTNIYIFFFRFFSSMGYYKILPYGRTLFSYFIDSSIYLLIQNS